MRMTHFKNANVDVSQLAVGTWGLDSLRWNGAMSEDEAIAAIRAMIQGGVNLIDTAPNYGNHSSEQIVGKAIQGLNRSEIYISTKFGTHNDLFTGGVFRDARFGTVMEEMASSLRNLQTDYVDFYFLHWPDTHTPIAETMCALNFLKQQGKIRYIGLSNCDQTLLEEAMKYGQIDVIQPPFSMIDQRAKALMQWCAQRGIDTMTYGSLSGGILTGRFREVPDWPANDVRLSFYKGFRPEFFPRVMELMTTLDEIAQTHQVPVSQVAINWATQKDFVSTALVGVRSVHHVAENLNTFTWQLSAAEMQKIDAEIARLGLDQL